MTNTTTWRRMLAFTGVGALFVASATAMICPEPVREIIFQEPEWTALSPEQRKILEPLAGKWPAMKNLERKKWLGVAERYPELSPAEKALLQRRMQLWSDATPAQRQAARKQYTQLKAQPAAEKDKFAEAYRHYLESKADAAAPSAAPEPGAEAPAATSAGAAPEDAKPESPPVQTAAVPGEGPPRP